MKKIITLSIIVILLVVGGKLFLDCKQDTGVYSDLGGDFILQGTQGEVSLASFKDKVIIMYMGFTHCPDICPTSLTTMQQALEEVDKSLLSDVVPLFISVDHRRDSASTANEYIKYYIPYGVGLAGKKDQIDKLVKSYGAFYEMVDTDDSEDSAFEFNIDHTSRFYIIGKNGKLLTTVLDSEPSDKLTEEIQKAFK